MDIIKQVCHIRLVAFAGEVHVFHLVLLCKNKLLPQSQQFLRLLLIRLCKLWIVSQFQVMCYHGSLVGKRHDCAVFVETFLTEYLLYAAQTLSLDKVHQRKSSFIHCFSNKSLAKVAKISRTTK